MSAPNARLKLTVAESFSGLLRQLFVIKGNLNNCKECAKDIPGERIKFLMLCALIVSVH
jgi:hypothetical protein